jgi:hypothetical protein
MFCPRMLLTMMVIGDCMVASMVAGYDTECEYRF